MIDLGTVAPYNTAMIQSAIAEAVKARGYGAQSALARCLGVRVQTVNKWVTGQTAPEPHRWSAIEECLELEPGTLAEAAPDMLPAGSALAELARSEAVMVVEAHLEGVVRDLSYGGKIRVLHFAHQVQDEEIAAGRETANEISDAELLEWIEHGYPERVNPAGGRGERISARALAQARDGARQAAAQRRSRGA